MHENNQQKNAAARQRDRPLEPGDAAPPLRLRDRAGAWISPFDDAHAGHPAVVVFARLPEAAEDLAALLDRIPIDSGRRLFVAARPGPPEPAARQERAIWLGDPDGSAAAAHRFVEPSLACAISDGNGRLLALTRGAPAEQAAAIADALDTLAQPACVEGLATHPPVLVLPRVLSPEHCARLIAEWDNPVRLWPSNGFISQGYEEEMVSFKLTVESHGALVQMVLRDPPLERWIDERFARRLRREIHKVFQVRVPKREDYRIVRYDSQNGGYLGPHRDNPTEMTRHRLFTAVVALNAASDYTGGELCFPEYAGAGYRPAQGTAVVWSAFLLHAVRPVLSGQRLVLGTHLGL